MYLKQHAAEAAQGEAAAAAAAAAQAREEGVLASAGHEGDADVPFEVGARVRLDNGEEGVIKFVGDVHYFSRDLMYGIELDKPLGQNDGTVKVSRQACSVRR